MVDGSTIHPPQNGKDSWLCWGAPYKHYYKDNEEMAWSPPTVFGFPAE